MRANLGLKAPKTSIFMTLLTLMTLLNEDQSNAREKQNFLTYWRPLMTLLKFSQTAMLLKKEAFPLRMAFPAHRWLAAPDGQWQRLPDGRLLVTFADIEQLAWCLEASLAARSAEAERPARPVAPEQPELIPSKPKFYYPE